MAVLVSCWAGMHSADFADGAVEALAPAGGEHIAGIHARGCSSSPSAASWRPSKGTTLSRVTARSARRHSLLRWRTLMGSAWGHVYWSSTGCCWGAARSSEAQIVPSVAVRGEGGRRRCVVSRCSSVFISAAPGAQVSLVVEADVALAQSLAARIARLAADILARLPEDEAMDLWSEGTDEAPTSAEEPARTGRGGASMRSPCVSACIGGSFECGPAAQSFEQEWRVSCERGSDFCAAASLLRPRPCAP